MAALVDQNFLQTIVPVREFRAIILVRCKMGNISFALGIRSVMDVNTRILRRVALSKEEIKRVSQANAQQRQKYTLNRIVDNHELWTMFDGDELPAFSSSQNDVLHVWPNKEFALKFYSQTISVPNAVPIPINDWIDVVLYGPHARKLT